MENTKGKDRVRWVGWRKGKGRTGQVGRVEERKGSRRDRVVSMRIRSRKREEGRRNMTRGWGMSRNARKSYLERIRMYWHRPANLTDCIIGSGEVTDEVHQEMYSILSVWTNLIFPYIVTLWETPSDAIVVIRQK